MKRILFIFIVAIFVSCQEEIDYRIELSGTEWVGSRRVTLDKVVQKGDDTATITITTHYLVTLRFLPANVGEITIVFVSSADGVSGIPQESKFGFTYVYDYDLMIGQITYDVPYIHALGENQITYFGIKGSYLYENPGLIRNIEYRKK